MTATAEAFLADIIAHRDDDTPRMIYADWLEDEGEAERAEFIRVQVELASCKKCGGKGWYETGRGKESLPHSKCGVLKIRERELLQSRQFGRCTGQPSTDTRAAARYVWAGPVAQLDDPNEQGWKFTRGFVSAITCTASDFLAHADALTSQTPLERVTLTSLPTGNGLPIKTPAGMPNTYQARAVLNQIRHAHEWRPDDFFRGRLNIIWPGITFTLPPQNRTADYLQRSNAVLGQLMQGSHAVSFGGVDLGETPG